MQAAGLASPGGLRPPPDRGCLLRVDAAPARRLAPGGGDRARRRADGGARPARPALGGAAGRAILCSLLLRPPAARPAPQLALVAGVGIAEALEAVSGLELAIKWPNDVYAGGAKLAGILAEARDGVVVLGFGINVSQAAGELPPQATSLALATGRAWEREPVLEAVLRALERRYRGWVAAGLGAVRDELAARDALRGREVAVDGRAGLGAGIDAEGRLLVDFGQGPVAVESGDVVPAGYPLSTSGIRSSWIRDPSSAESS